MTDTLCTRRQLIAGLATLTGRAALAAPRYKPSLCGQFYVWTQHFQAQRKSLAEGVPESIAAMRRAGYRRIELMSSAYQPDVREKTFAALKEHRMEVPIVYNGGPMHEPAGAEKTVAQTLALGDIVRPAGTRIINFNPNPKPKRERKSDEELKFQAQSVNQLAKELESRGMQLILHHHDPEMAENAREWRHLLENTGAPLCLDLHWIYRGGQAPMALLREAGSRTASLHLRNSRQGVWTEAFGDGDIDYRAVARYLRESGYTGYLVVELAYEKATPITRPLEEDQRLSREYAERVFGINA